MDPGTATAATPLPPRPVEDTYWVVPGRLLVGAHPGSRSRAQAMHRLRRFLESGVTCFIDLTEPDETPAYETLLPFATPAGRRIEYLREPIVDHGVPASRETMARIVSMLDGALASDHLVYLHCRAGIGRSAMAAACWLAERGGDADRALAQLADAWPQAAQSRFWSRVPETEQQRKFVLDWPLAGQGSASSRPSTVSLQSRLRGAWFGLALGDAWGAASRRDDGGDGPLAWTQHTALALCAAESLFATGAFDARDQVERFVRWQRAGHCAATGAPPGAAVTADVAKALATFQWRRSPMAGSHDPGDVAATALPRVLAAAAFSPSDPAAAVALAAECARPTHQSPVILDACRVYAALLVSALRAEPAASWLASLRDTTLPGLDATRLHPDVVAAATGEGPARPHARGGVLQALPLVRHVVATAPGFEDAMRAACAKAGNDAALHGAIVGALYGAWQGFESLPAAALGRLAGAAQVEVIAASALQRALAQEVPA